METESVQEVVINKVQYVYEQAYSILYQMKEDRIPCTIEMALELTDKLTGISLTDTEKGQVGNWLIKTIKTNPEDYEM